MSDHEKTNAFGIADLQAMRDRIMAAPFSGGPIKPEGVQLPVTPGRLTSFEIKPEAAYDSPSIIDEIQAKVSAEDARMRRLLPPAPRSMHWESELQIGPTISDLSAFSARGVCRLVYRLVPDGRPEVHPQALWVEL
jgi:hypothetical protein